MVRLEALGLDYAAPGASRHKGSVGAFDGVEVEIADGALVAIVGPSGCGKTSLVRVVAGLQDPTRGFVTFGSEAFGAHGKRPKTAVIFQDFGLLPWKTVAANAELPLRIAGFGARARREAVAPILEELGLADFARFYPGRLSGGMRQRVALARALAQAPELLLMDEPFSSLDALTRESMQETLLELRSRRGTSVLLVTHSIEEAAYLADRVYVMRERNPGRVVAAIEAPAGRARGPAFRSAPAFLGYMSEIRRALEGTPEGAPPKAVRT
jgi:NitT/TauT family transport system ATP-binding protein